MRHILLAAALVSVTTACGKTEPVEVAPAPAPAAEAPAAAPAAAAPAAAPSGADTLEAGIFSSPKFNIRFRLPADWKKLEVGQAANGSGAALPGMPATSKDSISFEGPAGSGIRMVVANTESLQLAGTSFANLDDRVGFDQVNILPEKSQGRAFNGVPGYRTEGDALVRGDRTPIYFIAQALELPGKPTMVTIFVPGGNYYQHSDVMKGVLDSIEVLNLRQ
jgi:hypothetical protein